MNAILHGNFKKKFKKLPLPVRSRFKERLCLFLENKFNPILNNHSVNVTFPGCRSINVTGDYRAIFKEEGEDIIFINIGTHSELYG